MKPRRSPRPEDRPVGIPHAVSVRAVRARVRRRAHVASHLLGGLLALAAVAAPALGQGDVATEGALFLLLPVGGRAVGRGQAIVASVDGSEAVWWNPAGLARQEKRELAIHHSQPFYETTADAVTVVVPSSLLGVLAISANILDFKGGEQTDDLGNPIGTITTRSYVYAATYATTAGARLNAGVTYKVLQFHVGCSAGCDPGDGANATTSAIDVGAQYDLRGVVPVALGAAVRNLGPSLQVNDSPQRDKLPARLQLGVRWRVSPLERRIADTELAVSGDAIDRLGGTEPSWRGGVEATWRRRASLRAGYVLGGPDTRGAAIGFGIRQAGLLVDLGYQFGGMVARTEGDPVFLSLRYQF